jgi:hypothetical protein
MTAKISVSRGLRVAAGIAIVFGALSVVSGGIALFGGPAAQSAAGNTVPFVLWFNFLSGFVYVLAGIGIMMRKPWGRVLSIALAIAIVAVFALFGWHVFRGGAYEMRTMGAMVLRASIWIGISVFLRRSDTGQTQPSRLP